MPTSKKKSEAPLGEFEGKPVSAIKIIITKTGDGLSQAMNVEPKILHQGDTGYIVLAYEANKIRFDPSKDDEDSTDRVQILTATGAVFADSDLIGGVVETMRERIEEYEAEQKRLRDEARGIFTFDGGAEDGDGGSEPE